MSARKFESKLRWGKGKSQKSPTYWRNSALLAKSLDSKNWKNQWDKRKWRYSPPNWRYSQLRFKNTIKKYESSAVFREFKQLLISERKANQESIPEEQKTYIKPQIETISNENQTITKEATQNGGQTNNYFTVYNGKHLFRIEKNLQKSIHLTRGGTNRNIQFKRSN